MESTKLLKDYIIPNCLPIKAFIILQKVTFATIKSNESNLNDKQAYYVPSILSIQKW